MGIVVTTHGINLNKKECIVTIENDGEIIVDQKNIGCKLNANNELDSLDWIQRIKTIAKTRRAETLTANVNIDIG